MAAAIATSPAPTPAPTGLATTSAAALATTSAAASSSSSAKPRRFCRFDFEGLSFFPRYSLPDCIAYGINFSAIKKLDKGAEATIYTTEYNGEKVVLKVNQDSRSAEREKATCVALEALKIKYALPLIIDFNAKDLLDVLPEKTDENFLNGFTEDLWRSYNRSGNGPVLVFPSAGTDLYDLAKQDISILQIQTIATHLIETLTTLRNLDKPLIHRDLHPGNILFNSDTNTTVIIDWSVCCASPISCAKYGFLQETCRAPEIELGYEACGCDIDLWSVGSCLFSLVTSQHLFMSERIINNDSLAWLTAPSKDPKEYMGFLITTFGMPPDSFIEKGSRKNVFFDTTKRPFTFRGAIKPNVEKGWKVLLTEGIKKRGGTEKHAEQMIDLLGGIFAYENRRLPPLTHPFLIPPKRMTYGSLDPRFVAATAAAAAAAPAPKTVSSQAKK